MSQVARGNFAERNLLFLKPPPTNGALQPSGDRQGCTPIPTYPYGKSYEWDLIPKNPQESPENTMKHNKYIHINAMDTLLHGYTRPCPLKTNITSENQRLIMVGRWFISFWNGPFFRDMWFSSGGLSNITTPLEGWVIWVINLEWTYARWFKVTFSIPWLEVTNNHFKGSRFDHPNKVTIAELPGVCLFGKWFFVVPSRL